MTLMIKLLVSILLFTLFNACNSAPPQTGDMTESSNTTSTEQPDDTTTTESSEGSVTEAEPDDANSETDTTTNTTTNSTEDPAATNNEITTDSAATGDDVTTEDSSTSNTVTYEAGSETNTYWVTNPTSNVKLFVKVRYPTSWDGSALPVVVLVPGSTGDSDNFGDETTSSSGLIADEGFLVITFDPDGRGQSLGSENQNGYIQQDGLAAVLRFAAVVNDADADKIGLVTFSFGITMGSGTLARYSDLSVKYLIDWEGPSDRNETGGCDSDSTGHLNGLISCDDESFWSEREAKTFIALVTIPYQRLQTKTDHAQPDYDHTLKMVNAAVDGLAPWVRLNEESPDQTYTKSTLPAMPPDSIDRFIMSEIADMAKMLLDQ